MTFEEILTVLNARPSKAGYKAFCPVHPDSHRSLSIRETNGKVLVHCFAGCSQNDVLTALREQGLLPSKGPKREDLPQSRIEAIYDYVDENGRLLYQQVRFIPKDFKPRRPDPDNPGKFIWSVRQLDGTYAVRLVPYRLPELLASDSACIVEGEKDADTLHSHGFCATTNAFGAGNWREEFNVLFRDKGVFIIPDNDRAGWARAANIARGVRPFAAEVSVLALDAHVKDMTQWFEEGHSAGEFAEVVRAGGSRGE